MPVGPPGSPTFASFLSARFLPDIVYNDPAYDQYDYDVLTEICRRLPMSWSRRPTFRAYTVPLARYLRSGKKMIVWHGTEDTLMSHFDTIRSYESMADAAGRHAGNARLYTPPGVNHCGGGPGTDGFDMIGALTKWVEKGRAPDRLSATKVDSAGNVLFTRPLCEYPKYPSLHRW